MNLSTWTSPSIIYTLSISVLWLYVNWYKANIVLNWVRSRDEVGYTVHCVSRSVNGEGTRRNWYLCRPPQVEISSWWGIFRSFHRLEVGITSTRTTPWKHLVLVATSQPANVSENEFKTFVNDITSIYTFKPTNVLKWWLTVWAAMLHRISNLLLGLKTNLPLVMTCVLVSWMQCKHVAVVKRALCMI